MENQVKTSSVHRVLAHSYTVYFLLLLASVCLDIVFPFKIFAGSVMKYTGVMFILLGTIVVFWAQRTSRHLAKENLSHHSFRGGPYRYSRSPTHWGLFFLMLGFGVVANALFVFLATLFSFLITRFVFLVKEEKILEQKYGPHYAEYKKSVKL